VEPGSTKGAAVDKSIPVRKGLLKRKLRIRKGLERYYKGKGKERKTERVREYTLIL
jgi:hypothetical protein